MIKEREPALAKISLVVQTILSIISFCVSLYLVDLFYETLELNSNDYKIILFLIVPLWYILLSQFDMGRMLRMKMYTTIFVEYIFINIIGVSLLFVSVSMLQLVNILPISLLVFSCLNIIVLCVFKIALYAIMKRLRSRGRNMRTVLVIADANSYYFIDKLISMKDWGYQLYAIVSDSDYIKAKYSKNHTILFNIDDVTKIIDGKAIDEVMYCKSDFNSDEIRKLISICAEVGIVFRLQSELLTMVNMKSCLTNFSQVPFRTFSNGPRNYLALKLKLVIDFISASLILLFISPVMFTIALLIKLDDGGPIFFRQKRVGLNGRSFPCLKFRTMLINAEALKSSLMDKNEQEGPVFKIKKDPRVTRIGNFLRKTSLDELPQFINVLRGEMSIVGPRPPVPEEVKQYERWQRRRLSMRPGITCIWQVSGRNNIPFDQWMKMDMQYIDTWSLKLDFVLFIKTFKVMLTGDGQ